MKSLHTFRIVVGSALLWSTGFVMAVLTAHNRSRIALFGDEMANDRPFRGGKVNAVAGVPGNAGVYYLGRMRRGVEDDGRRHGLEADFRQGAAAPVGALALAPSNPNIIYAGTGVTAFIRTSVPGMAFTNPRMQEKRGNTRGWKTRGISGGS